MISHCPGYTDCKALGKKNCPDCVPGSWKEFCEARWAEVRKQQPAQQESHNGT